MLKIRLVLGLGLCTLLTPSVKPAEIAAPSPVGQKVDNFVLNDFYGKPHALADYKQKKVVVIAVLGTECPLVKLYGPRLAQMQRAYGDKGVQFLGVNANRQDTITEIASYARTHQIAFPILKDLNNRLVDRLGAVRTPEIFVLDQDRVIRYHGRIDDQYGVGYARKSATQNFLTSGDRRPPRCQKSLAGRYGRRRLLYRPRASARCIGEGNLFKPGRTDSQSALRRLSPRWRNRALCDDVVRGSLGLGRHDCRGRP